MKHVNQKGFTLIELLVVIAIIGLLSTLAVVSLNNARERARDSKRISDVKQMQTALEMYYTECGMYPEADDSGSEPVLDPSAANGCDGSTTFGDFLADIPEAPTPPDGSCDDTQNNYDYRQCDEDGSCDATLACGGASTANCASYALQYCLGSPTGGVSGGYHSEAAGNAANPTGMQ